MIELPFVFIAGLLASAHCIGMCGPFALALSIVATSWRSNFVRQLIYSVGRIFTYIVLGATAGFGGWQLARHLPWISHVPSYLAVVAGLFLTYQGLVSTGLLRRRTFSSSRHLCLVGDFFRQMMRSPRSTGVFAAGIITGLMPCGLVYAFLALAAATTNLWLGALVMAAFGLGTSPIMIAAGFSSSLLPGWARQRLLLVAAWCVVLTGFISITRGMVYLCSSVVESQGCPFCR